MKTIVVGDVHGCYKELKELLGNLKNKKIYNPKKDKLVFLGDYIDRGKDSRMVVKTIRDLQKNNKNVIALMGNHEDMCLNYITKKDTTWLYNGCNATFESYKGHKNEFNDDIEWMKSLPLYHEDGHFCYVHAGVDTNKGLDSQDRTTLLWTREAFIYNPDKFNRTVVFGHTPTLTLNGDLKPVRTFSGNIGIDTGCVYDGALTALIIENNKANKFYQVSKIKK